jgi:nitroimidazol reductase NimA-like FMN-containing flavoprotein (pyridoxamine 5'-phosphate oxidase superfamily)
MLMAYASKWHHFWASDIADELDRVTAARELMVEQRYADDKSTSEFRAISPARCQELLESQSVGRIAWQAADGPQILPVTYAWHQGVIIFRTSPYGVLSELIRPTAVAFEVDELDQVNRRGWSVVVQGRAQGVAEPDQLVQMWTVGSVVPWAAGVRNVFIQVTPHKVTGRVVAAQSG